MTKARLCVLGFFCCLGLTVMGCVDVVGFGGACHILSEWEELGMAIRKGDMSQSVGAALSSGAAVQDDEESAAISESALALVGEWAGEGDSSMMRLSFSGSGQYRLERIRNQGVRIEGEGVYWLDASQNLLHVSLCDGGDYVVTFAIVGDELRLFEPTWNEPYMRYRRVVSVVED